MASPRKPEICHGVTITEMDVVRGAVGFAVACGLSAEEIGQAAFADGVDTLEDFNAAIEAVVKVRTLCAERKGQK